MSLLTIEMENKIIPLYCSKKSKRDNLVMYTYEIHGHFKNGGEKTTYNTDLRTWK